MLSENLTVGSIIEILDQVIPQIEIQYVDSEIMNQLSYEVSDQKIRKVGFNFSGNIRENIIETINLFRLKKLENVR